MIDVQKCILLNIFINFELVPLMYVKIDPFLYLQFKWRNFDEFLYML